MPKQLVPLFIFFILAVLPVSTSIAQDILDRSGVQLPIKVFITKNQDLTLEDILAEKPEFKSPEFLQKKSNPTDVYWIQVDFIDYLNTIDQDSIWYLRNTSFDYLSIFYTKNNAISEIKRGTFEHKDNGPSILYTSGFAFNKASLVQDRYLYLKAKRTVFIDHLARWGVRFGSKLQNELLVGFYSKKDLDKLRPVYTFTGICVVMFILTLAYFLYSKRIEFLYYSLYVLFLVFYLSSDIYHLHEIFFGQVGLLSYSFFQASQIIINLFYILFIIYYLDSKTHYPKLHIALKIIVYLLLIFIALEVFFVLSSNFMASIHLMNLERIVMTVFGLAGMIYLLIKTKDKLGYFIVIGSFFYMIGALALLFTQVRMYMVLGSSLEIFIFACGLTYKIQQEYQAKLKFQKESLLFENKALRAQMNPHFIFNSLSSIQHLIISGKKEASIKYLNKFSLLMRNLLESSIETNVILTEEISLLEKYLELESLRFNKSFQYTITVDEQLDPDSVEVPALIVQPFVENAILHGLLKKVEGEKQLQIRFSKEERFIICEVEDNGIGRSAAESLKTGLKNSKKSRGIEVTEKRLQILNKSEDISFQIIDKTDELGNATGTLVIIKIGIE